MAETLNTVNGTMKTLMGYEICDEVARSEKVAKAGDTMTGDLKIKSKNPSLRLLDADGNKAVTVQGINDNHRAGIFSYPIDSDEHAEGYYFPVPSTGLTGNKSYYVLTSKSPVTVAQGGTGANNVVDALHNLGIHWGEDDAEDYWAGLYPDEEERKSMRSNTIYIQIN